MKTAMKCYFGIVLVFSFSVLCFAQDSLNVHRVGQLEMPSGALGVTVSGNYAYIANGASGLRIIDITNPASLSEIGFFDTPGDARGVVVSGNYAYVADYGSGLRIIDISNPSVPFEAGFYNVSGYIYGVAVAGNYAYLADYNIGIRIVNVANPSNPTEIGHYSSPGKTRSITVEGIYAYLADDMIYGLRIVNIANPAAPFAVGFYATMSKAHAVAVTGNYAYVADYDWGLRIVNVSNPSSPVNAGFLNTPGYAVGVAVSGDYTVVADRESGLRVINIVHPSSPREVGFYNTQGQSYGVALSGTYAYIADHVFLGVYDFSQSMINLCEVQIIQYGPPTWRYRLVHRQGCVDRLIFTRFCPGTIGSVSPQAAVDGWSMLDDGDGNNGDSIIFVASRPLASGFVEYFRLSHPSCVDLITWCAGDTCGSIDGPLPVELLSFSAVPGDAQVMLSWRTASETGCHHFEIERDGAVVNQTSAAGDAVGHDYSWTDHNVINEQTYHYSLWSIETSGERQMLSETDAIPRAQTSTITEYALHGNYPNPFNPETEIVYDLPNSEYVTLKVFDLMGREVVALVNDAQIAGRHHVKFNASDLSSGVYLCRMTAGDFTASHKMMLLR